MRPSSALLGQRGSHEPPVVIKNPEFDGPVEQVPCVFVDFLAADSFLAQRATDEDQVASPFDFAGPADTTDFEVIGIFRLSKTSGIAAGRWKVVACGRRLVQCFVWSFIVVDPSKPVERPLLSLEICSRW